MTRDRLLGVALCGASTVLLMSALQIRRVIPIGIGPGTFPLVLASALGVLGLILVIRRPPGDGVGLTAPSLRTLGALALYGGLVVFTLVAFRPLGFAATGAITMAAVGLMLGARAHVVAVAVCTVPPMIHLLFVHAFSVPLPAGLLAGVLP